MTARHSTSVPSRPRRLAGAVLSGGMALLLLLAALLVGSLPAQAQAQAPSDTLLRLAQLTPDPPGVELMVSSVADPRTSVITVTLRYGEVSSYQAVQPGDYVITMRPAGSTAPPAVSRAVSLQPGTVSTVASVRHNKTPDDLDVFTDDLTPPPADRARIRVINAVSPAAPLDVKDAGAQPVVSGLESGRASPYQEVVPGDMQWTVGSPGGNTTPVSFGVDPNRVASVLITNGDGGPKATVVVDAGGPAVVPPGPVHAGFGGTAGPAPGAAIGSGVLAVLAAVAAGVSVRLARRAG